MKKLIRVGDVLKEYGGEVLSGSYEAFGKPVACVGDKARCNKHGMTSIVQGTSGSTVNGKAVALDGHKCACGCTLVSSLSTMDVHG
ncbi:MULTISPECIES: PAAR domain-containing protein [Enterobacteriaceae]|uniref:PAAR domain-containing protein n=1 Tax=Lelliottia wanjuensis TaxID=3050585 RepID=A0AAP4FU71_9ENTR|nr:MULTISPECIES: PAAR domain-containing protein [Enterobacteriaceae]AYN25654.1 PAAR domain-containing protein [Buttiauxella sp. 3AFRM03]MDK9362930.1 PAAR domain-containing protein [Lelliottia sp. V106_12]MDK9616585.1 PAAR domain-containing protein [Lelliottia sp. V106_9]